MGRHMFFKKSKENALSVPPIVYPIFNGLVLRRRKYIMCFGCKFHVSHTAIKGNEIAHVKEDTKVGAGRTLRRTDYKCTCRCGQINFYGNHRNLSPKSTKIERESVSKFQQ